MLKPRGLRLILIAAVAHHRVIGQDNRLPWHLKEDLRHFKALTWGKPIIMGRKTFESIGKALAGRRNLVLTQQQGWQREGVECVSSLDAALQLLADQSEAFIIGGGQLYAAALPYADCLALTEIDAVFPGDTCFPDFQSTGQWVESARQTHCDDSGVVYSFVEYQRVNNRGQ